MRLTVDRTRLERILAPLVRDGLEIDIEAGGHRRSAEVRAEVGADVVIDGVVVARLAARGPAAARPGTAAALRSLATAIAELETESRARTASEVALRDHRSAHTAGALGTDPNELAKGRRQQRSILSLVAPDVPGYDLASHYEAARQIGGDFFELFRLARRGHPLGIVIADVSGKGLDAAILMAFSRAVMHSALNASRHPADALARTNRVLVGEGRGTLFITALAAMLAPRTGHLRLAGAGHEPPWLIPGDGGPIREVGASGVIMGLFAEIDPPEVELTLAPGDRLLLYTDGVTDAQGPDGERFGEARLGAAIERAREASAHDLVGAICDEIGTFRGPVEPADDVTIVAIGRHRAQRRRR